MTAKDAIEFISSLAVNPFAGDEYLAGYYESDLPRDEFKNKLINAILRSVPPDDLKAEYERLCGIRNKNNLPLSLLSKIRWILEPPKAEEKIKNEPISTLLRYFTDKKSGKVAYARSHLAARYDYQSWRDQRRILKAFLSSGKTNCAWACSKLNWKWDPSFSNLVKEAWEKYPCEKIGKIIIQRLPKEYLMTQIPQLLEQVRYSYVYAHLGNESGFLDVYRTVTDIPIEDWTADRYLYAMAKLGRKVDPEDARRRVTEHFTKFEPIYPKLCNPGISSFPSVDLIIWALGKLGQTDTLVWLTKAIEAVSSDSFRDWSDYSYALKKQLDPQWEQNQTACNDVEPGAVPWDIDDIDLDDPDIPEQVRELIKDLRCND